MAGADGPLLLSLACRKSSSDKFEITFSASKNALTFLLTLWALTRDTLLSKVPSWVQVAKWSRVTSSRRPFSYACVLHMFPPHFLTLLRFLSKLQHAGSIPWTSCHSQGQGFLPAGWRACVGWGSSSAHWGIARLPGSHAASATHWARHLLLGFSKAKRQKCTALPGYTSHASSHGCIGYKVVVASAQAKHLTREVLVG